MASPAAPPNPCLLAVLLVCQARTGRVSQIVFHYPPDPLLEVPTSTQNISVSDDDTSSDSEDWSSEDDYPTSFGRHTALNGARLKYSHSNKNEESHHGTGSADLDPPASSNSEMLLGLNEEGLVALLTPDRTWHKRKFELGINDLSFVGRPVFVRQSGVWAKHKRKNEKKMPVQAAPSSETEDGTEEDEIEPTKHQTSTSEDIAKEETQVEKSPLTMFHMVFVMNPPALESNSRIKDMYDHVIKKFCRSLKLLQEQHNYVWQQAELIMSKKSSSPQPKRLSGTRGLSEVLEHSSLAKAMVTVFNAISTSRIAPINLAPGYSLSLQIPPVTSTSYLPSLADPPIQPGLWLTTATESFAATVDTDAPAPLNAVQLAKSYTLLLKAPPQRIIEDARAVGGDAAIHIPKFVAALRPTKSFYKLAASSHISRQDVQHLARHLIYWRKGILIPPLHQRDTYILSPNADLTKIRQACRSYQSQFPASMPSLPRLLSSLSGIPAPYTTLIPSPDHKEIYYLVLAWLLRNGWVTQLRTFAYVRVPVHVKRAVREQTYEPKTPDLQAQQSHRSDGQDDKSLGKSPYKRPSFVSRISSDGRRSIGGSRSSPNHNMASLIMSPPKASPEESKWLDHIAAMLTTEGFSKRNTKLSERQELRRHWPTLVKYFNGSNGLETIAIRQGWKRKDVWELLTRLGLRFNGGVEDEDGNNNSILLTIRHW